MIVAAIPACNEQRHIGRCLQALDAQAGATLDCIVLVVNNTIDDTVAVARSVTLRPSTRLRIIETTLPPARANAGWARRLAMQAGAEIAGPAGLLATTDADGEVDPTWLAATCAEIQAGAEVVAGRAVLHPEDWAKIPLSLHEADARECAYDALCDAIHARLDPDVNDPLPRHTENSGASIAVTGKAFRRCGGVPDVPTGEDRALVAALRRVDARIRHAPGVRVLVSGRTEGRAAGGMADTIRRRMVAPDDYLDDRLEPVTDCIRRALARAEARRCYNGSCPQMLSRRSGLPIRRLEALLARPWFGAAWEAIEQEAPLLVRRRVAVADLSVEMAAAQRALRKLKADEDLVIARGDVEEAAAWRLPLAV